jgi:hypothetical protein
MDTVTGNQASVGQSASGGGAGSPGGLAGMPFNGTAGAGGKIGSGLGSGMDLLTGGTATIDNTLISGNTAATHDNDVHGTFSPGSEPQ